MRKLPKKNISLRMSDVRRPDDRAQEPDEASPSVEEKIAEDVFSGPEKNPFVDSVRPVRLDHMRAHMHVPRRTIAVVVGVFLFASVAAGYIVWKGRNALIGVAASGQDSLQNALDDMRALDFGAASENLREAGQEFSQGQEDASSSVYAKIYRRFGGIIPSVKKSMGAFGDFQGIVNSSLKLSSQLDDISRNGISYVFSGEGDGIIPRLEGIRDAVRDIKNRAEAISRAGADTKDLAPFAADAYLPLSVDLGTYERSLSEVISWLKEDKEHTLIVLLQNPAELRATGGFLGSYAEVKILHGRVSSFSVRDISDVDAAFKDKVVPPKAIQAISRRWFPSDANWSFDFPVSAARIAHMFERSQIYAPSGTVIDGVIAITPKVAEDILSLTGPLSSADKTPITSESFMPDMQRSVQEAQSRKNADPKKILSDAAVRILEAVKALPADKKGSLLPLSSKWLENKDIMVYMKNSDIRESLDLAGVDGRVMPTTANFNGDYFAVVFDTLQGGKSDAYVKRNITLQSQVGLDGVVANHAVIESVHRGDRAKDWWYKEENKGYLRVFTPQNASLESVKGIWDRAVPAPVNYDEQGFERDSTIAAVEATKKEYVSMPGITSYAESGKNVFAAWTRVPAGSSRSVSLDYSFRSYLVPSDGQNYQFIFEKQPGVKASYTFEISAPVGYVWRQNGLPIYELTEEDIPARLVVDLTFVKG